MSSFHSADCFFPKW